MKIEICHLYPDVLNLYGDRGNVSCMKKRLQWRGIEAAVTEAPIGSAVDADKYDIFFIGGGQDFEQEVLLRDLSGGKSQAIREAVEGGKVFLAICGGYQMLGSYYETWDGKRCDFIGAVDFYSVGGKERMIGNFMFKCGEESGSHTVVGFENHSGRTYLGKGVSPLGTVICGRGNNGEDGGEGARYKNVFCSYSHGPILPKNPGLCDELLSVALKSKYPGELLAPLEDRFERRAHEYMTERLKV